MADGVFNIAKGKVKYYAELPATNDALLMVLLLSAGLEADDTLNNYTNLSTLLAATNDEATFTNYSRKTLTSVAINVDNTNNRVDIDCADVVWTAAGGATNNTLGKALIVYDDDTTSGTDTNIIPLTYHDLTATTDGSDYTIVIATAGFFRAS